MMKVSFSKLLTATFLITGTSIGGGMLGLPVMTGRNGLLLAMIMMLMSGIMMYLSGLLYVELSLATPDEDSSERLAKFYLGPLGHRLFQFIFLFMSFASLTAYADGGGEHVVRVLRAIFSVAPDIHGGIYCTVYVFFLLVMGTLHDKGLHRLNNLLTLGLIISYFFLVSGGISQVQTDQLLHIRLDYLWRPLPVFLTSFSCQAFVIPSLTHYLDRDKVAIKRALIGGFILSFFIYGFWELLVLGIVPLDGANGLIAAETQGRPVTQFLQDAFKTPWVAVVTEFFSFFALTTSFLGIFYGLAHFLKELLPKKYNSLRTVNMLIVVPILIINFYGKGIFLHAMNLTGSLGDTLLNGLIPISMVWYLRYKLQKKEHGKTLLIIMALFYLFVAVSSFF